MIDIPDFVYPKDAQGNAICPRCRNSIKACTCPAEKPKQIKLPKFSPTVRLDKSGRNGKVVTLITGLPNIESYLKNSARELKSKTGSGGTHYVTEQGGVIEIQGDHQAVCRQWFSQSLS